MAENKGEVVVHEEEEEAEELKQCLPNADFMGNKKIDLVKYQNFWFLGIHFLKHTLRFQKHFHARDTDLIVTSHPKTGTTWLNTLLFAVINRIHHPTNESPLLSHHPHHLVYRLENGVYGEEVFDYLRPSQLIDLPSPRLLMTHFPYTSLPESIKNSECRILYIARNPLDTIVSQWHFYTKVAKMLSKEENNLEPYSMEDHFEDFLQGKILFGPFFEHVVEYWKQSLERPHKVLFLKYEDLKDNTTLHVKRIADFVGMPFSLEEENGGVITEITNMCNINNMKELDANKDGLCYNGLEKESFFRKGEVGDWTNYFTTPMVERMNKLMQEKLEGTGLTFKFLP